VWNLANTLIVLWLIMKPLPRFARERSPSEAGG
jgi:hypothetical protein